MKKREEEIAFMTNFKVEYWKRGTKSIDLLFTTVERNTNKIFESFIPNLFINIIFFVNLRSIFVSLIVNETNFKSKNLMEKISDYLSIEKKVIKITEQRVKGEWNKTNKTT